LAVLSPRGISTEKTNSFANKKGRKKSLFSLLLKKALFVDFSTLIPNTRLVVVKLSSSPTDLIGITNAQQVLWDYQYGQRSCGFATTTVGAVYSHSKAIQDRLNNLWKI
jgi:hypothetical protein